MQNGFPYLDILIFGIIAIFLIFRLKGVLGTKTGYEESNIKKDNQKENFSNVVPIKSDVSTENKDVLNNEIIKIKNKDVTFDKNDFLQGSRIFFKMVLESFVSGNLDNVKDFIKPSVLKLFKTDIDERNKENENLVIDLKSITKCEILTSKISKTSIKISVKFESYQIIALLDKNEEIVDGDLNKEKLIKDIWVFEKKVNSDNINWTLVETKNY